MTTSKIPSKIPPHVTPPPSQVSVEAALVARLRVASAPTGPPSVAPQRQKSLQQATQKSQTSRMRAELPWVQFGAITPAKRFREPRYRLDEGPEQAKYSAYVQPPHRKPVKIIEKH